MLANVRKRERSASPVSNELYFVYESKRRTLWSNYNFNKTYDDDDDDSTTKNQTSKTLKSLFNTCLTFIAKHIESVESFIDFPSQVGLLIFKECLKIGRFEFNDKNEQKEEYALVLFAQAYPEYFTQSVNLDSNPVLLRYLSNVLKYCSIKKLDLTNCDLTMTSVNLNDILQSSFHCLELLNLSKNNLDHEFIKKFTLSRRLNLADNYTQLKLIDLRENYKLTPQCIKYFSNYQSLNEILLTVDRFKEYKFSNDDKFRVCYCSESFKIETDGWLKDILDIPVNESHRTVNLATKEYNEHLSNIRNSKSSNSILSFYTKSSTTITTTDNNKNMNRYETKRLKIKCYQCFKEEVKKQQPQKKKKESTTINVNINIKIDDELLKMYTS